MHDVIKQNMICTPKELPHITSFSCSSDGIKSLQKADIPSFLGLLPVEVQGVLWPSPSLFLTCLHQQRSSLSSTNVVVQM